MTRREEQARQVARDLANRRRVSPRRIVVPFIPRPHHKARETPLQMTIAALGAIAILALIFALFMNAPTHPH